MRAGQLRHRVSIQLATGTADTFGEESKTWTTIATVWGAVWPLRGAEREEAHRVIAEVTHRMRVRYNTTLNSEHRFLLGTRMFEIGVVINFDERNKELELLVKEAV